MLELDVATQTKRNPCLQDRKENGLRKITSLNISRFRPEYRPLDENTEVEPGWDWVWESMVIDSFAQFSFTRAKTTSATVAMRVTGTRFALAAGTSSELQMRYQLMHKRGDVMVILHVDDILLNLGPHMNPRPKVLNAFAHAFSDHCMNLTLTHPVASPAPEIREHIITGCPLGLDPYRAVSLIDADARPKTPRW